MATTGRATADAGIMGNELEARVRRLNFKPGARAGTPEPPSTNP